MKNLLTLILSLSIISCSNDNYKDVSSRASDKQYYNLVEKQVYNDMGVQQLENTNGLFWLLY
tara:strand:- start:30 stop:215 length:186 start_codon:yes stop_codon:yes gene_type:complete